MARHPIELRRDADTVVRLDPTRVLLGFRAPQTADSLTPRLQELDLELEPSVGAGAESPMELVNHTDRRFWVRSPLGEPIEGELFDALGSAFDDELEWIGPVYHHPAVPGRAGLHCPLPNVLVIKDGVEEVPLREETDKSRYLPGYRYYTIDEPRRDSAYQARSRMLERGTHGDDSVVFENMPLLVPLAFEPVDTHYPPRGTYRGQWNMAKIRAGDPGRSAWDLTLGRTTIRIAVLDSGCDLTHPDLRFVAGHGGPNDDGADNPALPNFAAGHGTMVAGVAGATTHNLKGVAGVAGGCVIMPFAFTTFTDVEAARAISRAADEGARVINMSLNAPLWNPFVDIFIAAVDARNVVVCAASGNTGGAVGYPASSQWAIACGATDQNDDRVVRFTNPAWASNFGAALSVMAPGIDVPTTTVQGTGDLTDLDRADWVSGFWGTSAATPHVAGLAALILSLDPSLTSAEVRDLIEGTADKVGGVSYASRRLNGPWNVAMGHGRINAMDALLAMRPPRMRR